jgi:hypothetical protein
MRKRQSFKDLIDKNKRELLSNDSALEKIDRRLEDKHSHRA